MTSKQLESWERKKRDMGGFMGHAEDKAEILREQIKSRDPIYKDQHKNKGK